MHGRTNEETNERGLNSRFLRILRWPNYEFFNEPKMSRNLQKPLEVYPPATQYNLSTIDVLTTTVNYVPFFGPNK